MSRKNIVHIGTWLTLVLFMVYTLAPVYLVLATSLKTTEELLRNTIGPPGRFRWNNYVRVWTEANFKIYFFNSIAISVPSVFLVLICSFFAGYAFAKMKFLGRISLFFVFLMGMTLPLPCIVIPIYFNLHKLGLLDTRWGVILPQTAMFLPFGVFLMMTFFMEIPDEIIDASKIDGANEFQLLIYIVLPLVQRGLKTVGLIVFMWAWQDYLLPLVVITQDELKPLTVGMEMFIGRYTISYTLIATAAVIVFLPLTVLFLFLQRTFIKGLTMGAVKG